MRLEDAEDRFRLYLESNPALVVVLDREGRIEELNAAGAELLGVDAAGVIGTDWFQFVPPEQRTATSQVFQAVMAGNVAAFGSHENDIVTARGERRTLLWRNAFVRDRDGKVTAGISTGVDITARRELEARLAASEARHRLVFDSAYDWETFQDPEGALAYCSPSCQRVTGHPAEAFLADPWLLVDITHPDDASRMAEHLDAVRALAPVCELDFRIRTADGGERWLHHVCQAVVDPEGRFQGRRASNRDVTERQRADLRYRQLFEHMTEGFAVHEIILDDAGRPVDYRFLQVNAAFERLTGLEAGKVTGRRVLEIIPDLEPAFIERYGRVALTGEPVTFEQGAGALGRVFQVHAYQPGPGRFACIFTDVTAQRETLDMLEDALRRARASEQSLGLVASHVRDVIWAYDLQAGRYTYMSPGVEGLRGVPLEEALTEPLEASLTPESMQRAAAVLARVGTPEEENPHVGVYDMPCRDGTVKQVEVIATYERDANGFPGTIFGITRDVTERVHAERALQVSEALYRSLFNAVPAGAILTDASGRILAFNDRAAADHGYSREEFGKLAIWEIDATDDEATVAARAGQVMRDGLLEFDTLHRTRSGELRDVRVRTIRVDRAEGPSILAIWEDVTEWRRTERARETLAEQLREAQKLESIGRLAGGVAHDLNNILVVFLGCADGLRRSLQSGSPPEAEDVEELQEGARRAREMTEQLLAFARRRVVAPVPLNLNDQVREAERMLRRLIGENVELALRLAPNLWTATCDPGQLSQLLVNLALNARDAMPEGGRLGIATENVELSGAPEAGWHGGAAPAGSFVRLTVEDSGAGIPAELGSTVFEPFVTTKPTGKGTGLGLATVYGIVQQAGGVVRYRSESGRGTVFEILLPRSAGVPAASAPPPTQHDPTVRPGGQILLVEDDPHVRSTVKRALQHGGYEVLAASSGEEALELLGLTSVEPRLLVTDVIMQGMNGRQVADAVRRARPGIPVLFMSGYAGDILARHGTAEPGLHLIEKPFTTEALLERVRGLLES